MEKLSKCLLCGSVNIKEFYRGTDNYFSKKEVVFSACHTCSLIFQNPRPSAEEYEKMYAEVFQDQRRGLDSYEKAVERVKSKGYDHKKCEAEYFRDFIDKTSAYLDIGGAWGTLAHAVRLVYGTSADIIEPSEMASRVAREFHGFTVHTGDFESFFSIGVDKKYDFVSLSHVLEHMLDPNDFLRKLRSVLTEKGHVYIAVPDVSRPFEASDRFFHIEHTCYFSPRTLRQILEKNGFEVVKEWGNDDDLKVIAKKGIAKKPIFSSEDLEKIGKKIAQIDGKYRLLKRCKSVLYKVLPESWQHRVSSLVSRFLKKIKIIKL